MAESLNDEDDGLDLPASQIIAALAQRLSAEALRLAATPLEPALYLVATPIGNLADITLRALAVLARADRVYCEDTRHSRTLLSHFGIGRALRPYHEHNASEQRPRILAELSAGRSVALISDAGTPLVSDPGFKLVRDAIAAELSVFAVPGASAVLAALSVSGQPTDQFLFAGFLPARGGARRSRIEDLARSPSTLVLFEAPTRIAESLDDLAAGLGPRPAALARELTKRHEEVRRGTLDELAQSVRGDVPKGEIAIVIAPPIAGDVSDAAIEAELANALAHASLRDAARLVAEHLGVPKSRVYDLGLKLKR